MRASPHMGCVPDNFMESQVPSPMSGHRATIGNWGRGGAVCTDLTLIFVFVCVMLRIAEKAMSRRVVLAEFGHVPGLR